jgi:hypothetical protein
MCSIKNKEEIALPKNRKKFYFLTLPTQAQFCFYTTKIEKWFLYPLLQTKKSFFILCKKIERITIITYNVVEF